MNSWNFNSHPELSDTDFCKAVHYVIFGSGIGGGLNNALAFISANGGGAQGRFGLIQSWINQNFTGSYDDSWLQNIPSLAWVVIIPVVAIVAAVVAWRCWGYLLKRTANSAMNGSNSDGY